MQTSRIQVIGFLLFVLVSTFMFAQGGATGAIEGVVQDASGAAVPNAKVTVTNVDRNQVVRALTTDMGGNYAAPLIPIGNYEVKAEAAGFKTATRTGIVLNVNDDLKININLEVGAITESVEVREAAATVELGMATAATTIEGTQIRELSLATRNYEQLVPLMPGVTANTTDELYLGVSGRNSGDFALFDQRHAQFLQQLDSGRCR